MKFRFHSLLLLVAFTITLFALPGCGDDDPVDVPITDFDGNEYTAITIGSQTWMKENLKTTHFRNGDEIPLLDRAHWDPNSSSAAYANYDDQVANGNIYGRLYNWYAVNDSRGLAPEGWHVATEADWNELTQFLGGDTIAGGKLKEVGLDHWNAPNAGATDEVDFTALPGGERVSSNTEDDGEGHYAFFWTQNQSVNLPTSAIFRALSFNNDDVFGKGNVAAKASGFSVRLVKD